MNLQELVVVAFRFNLHWFKSDKIKWDFLQAVAVSVLLYGGTTMTSSKSMGKNLNGKILHVVLNKS